MPTYTFLCNSCKNNFDVEEEINKVIEKKCSICGSTNVRRVYKPIGISFKGPGFYVNDYKKKEKK